MLKQYKLENLDDFLQKLKKVVRIVLYGPAISQLDCMKAGPYQLPYDNILYCCSFNQKQSSTIKIHEAVNQLDIFIPFFSDTLS